jgi:hypothetical protein
MTARCVLQKHVVLQKHSVLQRVYDVFSSTTAVPAAAQPYCSTLSARLLHLMVCHAPETFSENVSVPLLLLHHMSRRQSLNFWMPAMSTRAPS